MLSIEAPGTPSITNKGETFPPSVLRPLTRIVDPAFGFPPLL